MFQFQAEPVFSVRNRTISATPVSHYIFPEEKHVSWFAHQHHFRTPAIDHWHQSKFHQRQGFNFNQRQCFLCTPAQIQHTWVKRKPSVPQSMHQQNFPAPAIDHQHQSFFHSSTACLFAHQLIFLAHKSSEYWKMIYFPCTSILLATPGFLSATPALFSTTFHNTRINPQLYATSCSNPVNQQSWYTGILCGVMKSCG